jgi:hypothetical protein
MDSNLGKSLIFVAIIVMWVAPFAISSVQQARRERSRANHPTARKGKRTYVWRTGVCVRSALHCDAGHSTNSCLC